MPRRFISKQERKNSYMKRGQLFTKKKLLIPTLTLVMMMFAMGIGPASPQEVLAATTNEYIEMTVEMPSISQHSAPIVKSSNQSSAWVDCGNNIWKVSNGQGGYVTNSWFQDLDGSWYMLGADGTMYSGLVTDQSTGKSYLLNTNHDGTYGRMLTTNGNYTVNGQSVYLEFDQTHNGTYGAILSGLSEARSSRVNEVSLPSIPTDTAKSETPAPEAKPQAPDTSKPDCEKNLADLIPGWEGGEINPDDLDYGGAAGNWH